MSEPYMQHEPATQRPDLGRIESARQEAKRARAIHEQAAEESRAARRALDAAIERLETVLEEELGPNEPTLFDADQQEGE